MAPFIKWSYTCEKTKEKTDEMHSEREKTIHNHSLASVLEVVCVCVCVCVCARAHLCVCARTWWYEVQSDMRVSNCWKQRDTAHNKLKKKDSNCTNNQFARAALYWRSELQNHLECIPAVQAFVDPSPYSNEMHLVDYFLFRKTCVKESSKMDWAIADQKHHMENINTKSLSQVHNGIASVRLNSSWLCQSRSASKYPYQSIVCG